MIDTQGGHYGIILETKKQKEAGVLFLEDAESILFLEDAEKDLCSYKAVRRVHEIDLHKRKDQLIAAYQNTGWMSPDMMDIINRVVNDCKFCKKFQKSVARPRGTLPIAMSFNKVVTLDLNEFGIKYVIWVVD